MNKVLSYVIIALLGVVIASQTVLYSQINKADASNGLGNINRGKISLLNNGEYSRATMVTANLQKGIYYHTLKRCPAMEWLELSYDFTNQSEFVEMTIYEADLRGFRRCPECEYKNIDKKIDEVHDEII